MENGYPDEEDLKFIREFDCSKEKMSLLIDFIENIWWASDWGFRRTYRKDNYFTSFSLTDETNKRKRKYLRLSLSTGGWSGNEDIIEALKQNKYFYSFYWLQSRRGGHYIFEIDVINL